MGKEPLFLEAAALTMKLIRFYFAQFVKQPHFSEMFNKTNRLFFLFKEQLFNSSYSCEFMTINMA